MKHIRIIARQCIIDPHTGKLHNDQGLMALNGYYESEIIKVEDSYDKNTVILDFEKSHPDVKADTYEICEQNSKEMEKCQR